MVRVLSSVYRSRVCSREASLERSIVTTPLVHLETLEKERERERERPRCEMMLLGTETLFKKTFARDAVRRQVPLGRRRREAAQGTPPVAPRTSGDKILVFIQEGERHESLGLPKFPSHKKHAQAIVDGLRDSIAQFSGNVQGSSPKDVIDLLLLTQYFDMLKEVGNQPGTSSVFLPNKGGQLGAVRDGLLQATAGAKNMGR